MKSWKFYANKSCKGLFCKENYTNLQLEKSEKSIIQGSASSCTRNVNYNDDNYDQHNQPRRSIQEKFNYQSFQEELKCAICAAVKKEAHRKVVLIQTMTF